MSDDLIPFGIERQPDSRRKSGDPRDELQPSDDLVERRLVGKFYLHAAPELFGCAESAYASCPDLP